VQIVEQEEIPLAYLTSPSIRIRAKAAGTLGGRPEQHLHADLARQARRADRANQSDPTSPTATAP
jgi:hypothetical protein